MTPTLARMNLSNFNVFCASLPATTHVVQWGGAHVWKVGGKVFVIGHLHEGRLACSFRVSDLAFEVLRDAPGLRPAPYLASRGLKWLQNFGTPALKEKALREHIAMSHRIIAGGLSKKKRAELGLLEN